MLGVTGAGIPEVHLHFTIKFVPSFLFFVVFRWFVLVFLVYACIFFFFNDSYLSFILLPLCFCYSLDCYLSVSHILIEYFIIH